MAQSQFPLDMVAENESRAQQPEPQRLNVGASTSQEIAAKIGELMRQGGIEAEANPMAAEKIQRDLEYQRQMEQFPQPDSAPPLLSDTTPGLDRLEQLEQERDAAIAEAKRWKKEFGRREGKVGGMESRIKELEARMAQAPPVIDVRAMTGHDPNDPITAQDMVNLMIAQSNAFGNTIRQVKEEWAQAQASTSNEPGLPLDLEAELIEKYPYLTDLARPQKLRAMQDILSLEGVSISPSAPGVAPAPQKQQQILSERGRAQVRETAFIEPSNRGSAAERNAIAPERQAYNEKIAKLKEALSRPGGAEEAAKIFASLGAGVIDETQMGYLNKRR